MSEALNPTSIKALVVDDSAVARKVLSSILHREGIEVDMAVSAEDALEFLATHTPDVIFLDHTMPGMSGFEALKTIKANPRTATIPVMMFTSQSGEVYMTQARALGAIDVLRKDSLADIDISKRLHELGVFKQQVRKRKATMELIDNKNTARQRQLATLIRLLVREEMARFKEELPVLLKQQQEQEQEKESARETEEEFQVWDQPQTPDEQPSRGLAGWITAALVTVLLLGWILWQLPAGQKDNANIELAENSNAAAPDPDTMADSNDSIDLPPINKPEVDPKLLTIIGWAIGDQMTYGPTEAPLGGDRFNRIQTLMTMLADSGFQGRVLLTVHQGQFCVETSSIGELALAPASTPVAECGLLASDIDSNNANLMSLPFTNFLQNSPVANGEQGIHLDVQSAGDTNPIAPYPDRSSGVLAGVWNMTAQKNNRITVELIPM